MSRFNRVDLAWIRDMTSSRIVHCDDEINDQYTPESHKRAARREKAELESLLAKAEARLARMIR